MLPIYLRLANIVYSRDFIDIAKMHGLIITRRNLFTKNCIIVNHGNSTPIKFGRKIRRAYLLNNPNYIRYCSNKSKSLKVLRDFYPETYSSVDSVDFTPVIVKPLNGHHGYGIRVFNSKEELIEFLDSATDKYIIQRYIPIRHEFRFNVLDRNVFQVSHKERLKDNSGNPIYTPKGGMVFRYRSLGANAKISSKFWDFIYDVIDTFHKAIGDNLAEYCIDVIKGEDKQYYLTELNSSYGIGSYTATKLVERIHDLYHTGEINKYRVV